jgi:hypothetical protein
MHIVPFYGSMFYRQNILVMYGKQFIFMLNGMHSCHELVLHYRRINVVIHCHTFGSLANTEVTTLSTLFE